MLLLPLARTNQLKKLLLRNNNIIKIYENSEITHLIFVYYRDDLGTAGCS